jgi:hypothetical protein
MRNGESGNRERGTGNTELAGGAGYWPLTTNGRMASLASLNPVLHAKTVYPPEFANVVRHER